MNVHVSYYYDTGEVNDVESGYWDTGLNVIILYKRALKSWQLG